MNGKVWVQKREFTAGKIGGKARQQVNLSNAVGFCRLGSQRESQSFLPLSFAWTNYIVFLWIFTISKERYKALSGDGCCFLWPFCAVIKFNEVENWLFFRFHFDVQATSYTARNILKLAAIAGLCRNMGASNLSGLKTGLEIRPVSAKLRFWVCRILELFTWVFEKFLKKSCAF